MKPNRFSLRLMRVLKNLSLRKKHRPLITNHKQSNLIQMQTLLPSISNLRSILLISTNQHLNLNPLCPLRASPILPPSLSPSNLLKPQQLLLPPSTPRLLLTTHKTILNQVLLLLSRNHNRNLSSPHLPLSHLIRQQLNRHSNSSQIAVPPPHSLLFHNSLRSKRKHLRSMSRGAGKTEYN